MGKTSLKTFVCSFVFSLFTILSVNKEFFSVPKPSDTEIKIPNKNISLFFKSLPSPAKAAKTIPVKKIALSVPVSPSTEKLSEVSAEDPIPLTFAGNDIEFDLTEKTAEASVKAAEAVSAPQPAPQQTVSKAEPAAPPAEKPQTMEDKIAANYQEIIGNVPPVDENELQQPIEDPVPFSNKIVQAKVQIIRPNEERARKKKMTTVSQEPETVLAQADIPITREEKAEPAPKPENILAPEIAEEEESFIIARVPDEDDSEENNEDNFVSDKPLPPTFKVAKAAPNPDTAPDFPSKEQIKVSAGEPENLLIPLEKDQSAKIETAEAKIIDTPNADKLAMLTGKATIRSMTENQAPAEKKEKDDATSGWTTMAEKNNEDSVWVAAKGTGHQRNRQITKEAYFKNADNVAVKQAIEADKKLKKGGSGEVKVASEVVNNLLIPIPEDILNDPNLTPQLVSSEKDKDIEQQVSEQEAAEQPAPAKQTQTSSSGKESGGLFKSITSIFSKNQTADGSAKDENGGGPSFFDQFTGKSRQKAATGKILPTEIRLAFQPNRAEISGVTLKWLQAFANKTIEEKNVGLEIRIDGSSSYELQQKRLNLLNNILASSGVDYRKINTVFTTREPNSFIIRTVRLNNSNGGIKENNEWQDYYKAW